ncbi:unnamed protein product [Trichogramma brassicae]|uniref:Uncharacterized protein n=1 Tax=Trichogramma brassicae TaxID=86971 RepID=A0A6H5HYU4_9HYME|nr:unnamed protein product [Trichogramma brassicae]
MAPATLPTPRRAASRSAPSSRAPATGSRTAARSTTRTAPRSSTDELRLADNFSARQPVQVELLHAQHDGLSDSGADERQQPRLRLSARRTPRIEPAHDVSRSAAKRRHDFRHLRTGIRQDGHEETRLPVRGHEHDERVSTLLLLISSFLLALVLQSK